MRIWKRRKLANRPASFSQSTQRLIIVIALAESAGDPDWGELIFVDMGTVERISLRYFSGKYREAEGAPGSFFEPGPWVDVAFRGVCDASRIEALLRQRSSAFHNVQLLSAAAAVEVGAGTGYLRERVGESTRGEGVHLLGYVVMPEHVHLLMSEPKQGTPSTVLQKLKFRVARKLRKRRKPMCAGQMRLPFAETGEPLRAFWQARFYDFNVYSKGKKREKLNYMHANPVIRGLVKHPRDWPWSSWGFYWGGAAGLVAIDVEE
jgi:REP element-mobilizing transposase RayT